jgi:hypothetical protein
MSFAHRVGRFRPCHVQRAFGTIDVMMSQRVPLKAFPAFNTLSQHPSQQILRLSSNPRNFSHTARKMVKDNETVIE